MTTNNSQNNLETLERLCELVEKSGVDIAPDYNEYMALAFAIANSCGEAGRSCFHRLCVLSYKYNATGADRLFTEAVKKGRGGNSLGTAFHLAEAAGVDLGEMRRFLTGPTVYPERGGKGVFPTFPTFPPPSSQESARARIHNVEPPRTISGEEKMDSDVKVEKLENPPVFSSYEWPKFLSQMLDCAMNEQQRDMIFCSALTTLGVTFCTFSHVLYANQKHYPCIQLFVVGPPASGKGAISWVTHLAMPFHREKYAHYLAEMEAYKVAYQKWIDDGKNRDESKKPVQPKVQVFLIAGDNTGTGIQENLADNGGVGLIVEAEAETLSAAISSQYGKWGPLLRKAFEHGKAKYNRRGNGGEYREIEMLRLGVAICGTPGQLKNYIPSSEDGLFSRELFYFMPRIKEFLNLFHMKQQVDYRELFNSWGVRWKRIIDAMKKSVSVLEFMPTYEQKERAYARMSQLYNHAGVVHDGEDMDSFVTRLAINSLRLMHIVALIRALDSLLMMEDEKLLDAKLSNITQTLMECQGIEPAPHVGSENLADGVVSNFHLTISEADFEAVLDVSEKLYRHAERARLFMPKVDAEERMPDVKHVFFASLPLTFSRKEYLAIGEKLGCNAKWCDRRIKEWVDEHKLERMKQGCFRFWEGTPGKNTEVSTEGYIGDVSAEVPQDAADVNT